MNALFDQILFLLRTPSLDKRIEFYQAMGDAAEQNFPQIEVLSLLNEEYKRSKHPFHRIVSLVLKRLQGFGLGSKRYTSVGQALSDLLPPAEVALILSGEGSGNFARGWKNAAQFARQSNELRTKIIGLLAKPISYFIAFIGVLIFFSIKVIPQFESVRPREQWGADAQLLGWASDHIVAITVASFSLIFFSIIGFFWLNRVWTGPWREIADQRFPIFTLFSKINCANFMQGLASFTSAGISFEESLQKMEVGATPYMKWQLRLTKKRMGMGLRPEESLRRMSMMPPSYHWILKLYSRFSAGSASEAYEKIAQQMMKKTIASMELFFGSILSNLMLALLGGGILWVYFALYSIVGTG